MSNIREEILEFIENNAIEEKWFDFTHPADIAEALEELEPEILHSFVALMDLENLARIIELADEDLQLEIINKLSLEEIIEIFSYMSTDNIIDILGNLSIDKRKSLLKEMKQGEANILRKLLGYDRESAGGLMTTEYIILKEELSKKDALRKIAEIGPRTEIIDIIYINNNKDELVGTVDLRELLNVSDEISLAEIMDENLIAVTPDVDQ
ncbi:MAG: magnesium transporter, partial [Halanaerobiales bacterium]